MSIILMTTLFHKALILQGEIWCWSLLALKGLREHMKRWFTQGSSGRRWIDPFYPGQLFSIKMDLKKLKKIQKEWDCVTSYNQVSWIDHERLYDTEQQNAIFKLSYVQTILFKTCSGGFLKLFFNAYVGISLRKFQQLKAICFSLSVFSEVKALNMCRGFAIFDCKWDTWRYLVILTLYRVVWT